MLKRNQKRTKPHQLQSEKLLEVVLCGLTLPTEITIDGVEQDLKEKQYSISKIVRMQGVNGPYPLVLIEISQECIQPQQLLWAENRGGSPQKKNKCCPMPQMSVIWTRTKNYHADFRCMKCGEEHSTHENNKPPTTKRNCAHCGEDDLSIARRWRVNPNNSNENY